MERLGSPTRREVLAGAGAATSAASAGCLDQLWNQAEHSPPEQISLTIRTLPSDDDELALRIASRLAENFRAAGIDAIHQPDVETELYRQILLDNEYEVFVAKHPGFDDLDSLRTLLHSQYVSEPGWQNPFGFSNVRADELLERQRQERGYDRLSTFSDLFEHLLDAPPFTAVAFPTHIGVTRAALDVESPPRHPIEYATVADRTAGEREPEQPLRIGVLENTFTDRLNPLYVGLGEAATLLDLLYDPLVRVVDGQYRPWLAESIEWNGREETPQAIVRLRDGTTWHDGEPLDADDVAFTVEFLADTSLGEAESGVPAPQYRGPSTLIESVRRLGDRRLEFAFGESSIEVARRALTTPVFPEHVWRPKAQLVDEYLTEARVWDNPNPIGSGLYRFREMNDYEFVRIEPFTGHPLREGDHGWFPDLNSPESARSDIAFRIVPNAGTVIEDLLAGDLDLLGSSLPPANVDAVSESPELVALETPSRSFYIVGFNARHPELSNPRFRRALSHLIDREHIVEEIFGGYAQSATTRSAIRGVSPATWAYPNYEGVPEFPGEDGEVDPDAARSLFREIGYRYDDGDLIS